MTVSRINMIRYSLIFFIYWIVATPFGFAQQATQTLDVPLSNSGRIPIWAVNGPFKQPLVGFGSPVDFDPIGEAVFKPTIAVNFQETDSSWFVQSVNDDGFLDFNDIIGWNRPGAGPEELWFADAAYAFTQIVAEKAGDAVIKAGGNSRMKIVLNGVEIYQSTADENANRNAQSIAVKLKQGVNTLLVRATRSHQNFNIVIFDELRYDWGFFLTLDMPAVALRAQLEVPKVDPKIAVESTIFYKTMNDKLYQRHDLYLTYFGAPIATVLNVIADNVHHPASMGFAKAGISRHEVWLPEISEERQFEIRTTLNTETTTTLAVFKPTRKYTLHLMPISHMDIGYTHTQPVVKELHIRTLDDVMDLCETDPNFRWTIETMWTLQAYKEGRSEDQFNRLIQLIKDGRISVSPFYSNPFTGMVDTEEMIRSLDMAASYRDTYGIEFTAAIYNDVPGQSWLLPQLLKDQGITFIANGLNEVYGGYVMQKKLPKIFMWEGADGSQVMYYRTESYNEGMAYGLERDNAAMAHRMWTRISRLQHDEYPIDHILLNAAFGDNLGIAMRQWNSRKRWNDEYDWPRIESSTLADFANVVEPIASGNIPVVRGDAISDWDVQFQGEPDRMQRYRHNQYRCQTGEKLALMGALSNKTTGTFYERTRMAVERQLEYSGHGSGLEYGYGTDDENARTLGYRESYVNQAHQLTDEVLERASYGWLQVQAGLSGEYAIVFNPHSYPVSAPVHLDFNPLRSAPYALRDLETGEIIDSYWNNFRLEFIAKDIPPMGWKKYGLQPKVGDAIAQHGLLISANVLENSLVRVELDANTGAIASITDKKSGFKNIADKNQIAGLLQAVGIDKPYSAVTLPAFSVNVDDRSPVSVSLIITRQDALMPEVTYTLYAESEIVHIETSLDLRKFSPTELPISYGIGFPISMSDADVLVETIGGFIDGDRDRLPGMKTNGYSMREVLSVSDGSFTVDIASPDNRVTYISRDSTDQHPTIIANIANHFPDNWNRREENDRILTTRFAIRINEGGFHPGQSHRFGQRIAMPPITLKGWYVEEPVRESVVQLTAEHSVLSALKALGPDLKDGMLIRIRNTHPLSPDQVQIQADWLYTGTLCQTDLSGKTCQVVDVEAPGIQFTMGPNEIRTYKWMPKSAN